MADERNQRRSRRMDLNLYLGLPRSPRPRSLDLGSDLALSSVPLPLSSAGETQTPPPPANMSGFLESSDSHTSYSPYRSSFAPEPPSADPMPPAGDDPGYSPYSPAYQPFSSSYQSFAPPPYGPFPPVVRGPDGSDDPYSPSYVQGLPTVEETEETDVGDGGTHLPYNPMSPPGLVDEPMARGGDSHMPYSPSYVPVLAIPQGHVEPPFTPYQPIHVQEGDILTPNDRPTSPQDLLRCPEFRIRRLIESHHRWHHRLRRRFRSLPYRDESFNFGTSSIATPNRVGFNDNMSSERTAETSGKNKLTDEGIVDEGLEEETEEKSGTAVNFECNICLDVAKEPVVTSCGHLFCWSCLYQWLHLHSDHKECPACKGEVTDSNIIPIYGRGSSETRVEKKGGEDGDLGLKIPPRPCGHRFESLRQLIPRPFSRRLGERITSSWRRRFVDEDIHNGNRLEAHADPGIIDGPHRRILTRLRARRLPRDVDNLGTRSNSGETGLPRHNVPDPLNGSTSPILRDGNDLWNRFSFGFASNDRSAAITSDLSRVVGSFDNNGSGSHSGAFASSNNPQILEPLAGHPPTVSTQAADQASVSSTMAVIQGDAGVTDASAEPNSAGSSRTLRRRERSSASSSEIDGGLHARKRRRLN